MEDFEQFRGRLTRLHPRRRLNESLQRLDDLQSGLLRRAKQGMRGCATAWRILTDRLLRVRPAQLLRERHELLVLSWRRLRELTQDHLRNGRNRFAAMEVRLRLLGPEQVLARGYSVTMDAASGRVLRDAQMVRSGQRLKTRLRTGEVVSRAEAVKAK